MPQSLYRLHTHIVFSTKNRFPFLKSMIQPAMYNYMTGIMKNLGCKEILIGEMTDHVHIYCNIAKMHAPVRVLEDVKKESSKWIKSQFTEMNNFYRQDGYGLFSISPCHIEAVRSYIKNQKEHHRTESFEDELKRLLRKYHIEINEKYLWD